jgi:hypothetical protein
MTARPSAMLRLSSLQCRRVVSDCAENVLASVRRGDPYVSGRLRVRREGRRRSDQDFRRGVRSGIGHDLSKGRSAFSRAPQTESRGQQLLRTDAA